MVRLVNPALPTLRAFLVNNQGVHFRNTVGCLWFHSLLSVLWHC